MTGENILLLGSVLLIAGVLIGKTSYRTGLPLLLVSLIVGMLFGTDGIGIHFNNMHDAQFVGMIALCVILFTGGMSTSLSSIRPVLAPGLVLSTVGVMLCLLPFRRMNMRVRAFVSWVGLRGAAPIIFATYPVVAGVSDAGLREINEP